MSTGNVVFFRILAKRCLKSSEGISVYCECNFFINREFFLVLEENHLPSQSCFHQVPVALEIALLYNDFKRSAFRYFQLVRVYKHFLIRVLREREQLELYFIHFPEQ